MRLMDTADVDSHGGPKLAALACNGPFRTRTHTFLGDARSTMHDSVPVARSVAAPHGRNLDVHRAELRARTLRE